MNATAVAAALGARAEEVCRRYLPHGRKHGRYWTAGDIRGARGRSLFVRLAPPGVPGKWTDAATGEHGDLLDLIRIASGAGSLRAALAEARAFLSIPAVPAPAGPDSYDRMEAARRLWRRCRAIDGTHAEAYLRARHIHRFRFPALRFTEHPDLPEHARNVLNELIDYHEDETQARETAEGYLTAAERHVEAYKILELHATERGLPVARLDAWPSWREAAKMLAVTGKAVLSNHELYGAYFDAMTIGKARARLTVKQLRSRLRENHIRAAKPELRQSRPKPTPKQEQGFAHILDDCEKLRELREKAEQRNRKRGTHLRRSRGLSM